MNKIMMLVSAFLISFSAQAGNDGPQATPSLPANVIAEYHKYGGLFVPPVYPPAYNYKVYTDRTVVETIYFNQGSSKTRVVTKLNGLQYSQLFNLVKQVRPGEIYDPSPMNPGCMDAPGSTYKVNNSYGEIEIGAQYNCKQMGRKNRTEADLRIMAILDRLAATK